MAGHGAFRNAHSTKYRCVGCVIDAPLGSRRHIPQEHFQGLEIASGLSTISRGSLLFVHVVHRSVSLCTALRSRSQRCCCSIVASIGTGGRHRLPFGVLILHSAAPASNFATMVFGDDGTSGFGGRHM
jgi:hypothetical protein